MRSILNLSLILLLSACSASSNYRPIADISGMEIIPTPNKDTTLYQKIGSKSIITYNSFYIHPVEVIQNSQTQKIDAETTLLLTNYFKKALKRELNKSGKLSQSESNSLGIKIKITGLKPAGKKRSQPKVNVTYDSDGNINKIATIHIPTPIDLSRVNIEAEFIEPSTGEVQTVVIAHRYGKSFLKPAGKWENVVNAFDTWASRFGNALNAVRN